MSRCTAVDDLTRGLSVLLHVPPDDKTLEALVVAYVDAAPRAYMQVSGGHGWVQMVFKDHWLHNVEYGGSDLPDVGNRKPPRK